MTTKKIPLSELCLTITDGAHSSPKSVEEDTYKIASVKDIKGTDVNLQSCKNISKHDFEILKKNGCVPQAGDILVGKDGANFFDDIIVFRGQKNIGLLSSIAIIRANKEKVDPKFLYYYFKQPKVRKDVRENYGSGSAIPRIILKDFKRLPVELPKPEDQKRIVNILSSLDSKIEINNKIIKNIENQIYTISHRYLTDKTTTSTNKIQLSEICDFYAGYSYKGTELKTDEKQIGLATIKNFIRNGGFSSEGFKPIKPSKIVKEHQFLNVFDIVVAHTDLTQKAEILGNAEMLLDTAGYQNIIASMDLVTVVPRTYCHLSNFLIASALKTKKFKSYCLQHANGTTVLHLSKKALSTYTFYVPRDETLLNQLSNVIESETRQISTLLRQNNVLSNIRDSLLPKLMSGNIELNN